jgi:hypothetical protein
VAAVFSCDLALYLSSVRCTATSAGCSGRACAYGLAASIVAHITHGRTSPLSARHAAFSWARVATVRAQWAAVMDPLCHKCETMCASGNNLSHLHKDLQQKSLHLHGATCWQRRVRIAHQTKQRVHFTHVEVRGLPVQQLDDAAAEGPDVVARTERMSVILETRLPKTCGHHLGSRMLPLNEC